MKLLNVTHEWGSDSIGEYQAYIMIWNMQDLYDFIFHTHI